LEPGEEEEMSCLCLLFWGIALIISFIWGFFNHKVWLWTGGIGVGLGLWLLGQWLYYRARIKKRRRRHGSV